MKNQLVSHILIASSALSIIFVACGCAKKTEPVEFGPSTTVSVPTNFDSALWKRNFPFDRETLYATAKNGLVDRFTEAQVLDILGEPDARRDNIWYYVVQLKEGGVRYLLVHFADGHVTNTSETFEPSESKK